MMCEQHHSFMGNVLLLVTNRYKQCNRAQLHLRRPDLTISLVQ